MTNEQIKEMSPAEVAKALAEYNKWRRGDLPYKSGMDPRRMPYSTKEFGAIVDRAVEILKEAKPNEEV